MDEEEITQTEMADRIGVSQPVVSDALKGYPNQKNTLFRLARELGFKVDKNPRYRFEDPSSKEGNVYS